MDQEIEQSQSSDPQEMVGVEAVVPQMKGSEEELQVYHAFYEFSCEG